MYGPEQPSHRWFLSLGSQLALLYKKALSFMVSMLSASLNATAALSSLPQCQSV
jgi:hypothetical protein